MGTPALTDKDWDRAINSPLLPRLPNGSPALDTKSSPSLHGSPIKSPALLSKIGETERLRELTRALKRKAGPAFQTTTISGRRTQMGLIPVDECDLCVPNDPNVLVYSARIDDYRRWIPLVRAERDDGRQRFRERYLADVVVPRGDDLHDAKGKLHAALEEELQREWMRTADANLAAKRMHVLRKTTAKEPVSTEVLLDSLRALPIKNVVQMLDKQCNPESVNAAAMEAAERIIMLERGDAIAAERARLQHALEVEAGVAPAPKRQASERGPFGETLDTHDIVYVNEKSGAGKGQRMTMRTWVPKSTPDESTTDNDSVPYIDSWRGIEFD